MYRGVVRRKGGPVEGIPVELLLQGARVGRVAITDAEGCFALESDLRVLPRIQSADGSYQHLLVLVGTPGDTWGALVPARPEGFQGTHVIKLGAGLGRIFVVKRPDGEPVVGAEVGLWFPHAGVGGQDQARPSLLRGTTDATGRCVLPWPKVRRAFVRLREPGGAVRVGYIKAAHFDGEKPVVLTAPRQENKLELLVVTAWGGPVGAGAALGLKVRWNVPPEDPLEGEGFDLPIQPPADGDATTIAFLDSPSFSFTDVPESAAWYARYEGREGQPCVVRGATVTLVRTPGGARAEITLPEKTTVDEPEDTLWLRLRETGGQPLGDIQTVSLLASHGGKLVRSFRGQVAWRSPSRSGARGQPIAIYGVPRPRDADLDAHNTDTISLVLQSAGTATRVASCSLRDWSRAYEPETALELDLDPAGPVVRLRTLSSTGEGLAYTYVTAMCIGRPAGGEIMEAEDSVSNQDGTVDVIMPRADAECVVLARGPNNEMGRGTIPPGTTEFSLTLGDPEIFKTTIDLADGKQPVQAHADLVSLPVPVWTVPCSWDAETRTFTSSAPVVPGLFEVRMWAVAIVQQGSDPRSRKQFVYEFNGDARKAHGQHLKLPLRTKKR